MSEPEEVNAVCDNRVHGWCGVRVTVAGEPEGRVARRHQYDCDGVGRQEDAVLPFDLVRQRPLGRLEEVGDVKPFTDGALQKPNAYSMF